RLSVPGVDRLLNALPSLEDLVVQASDAGMFEAAPVVAPRLRRLILRAEALDPRVVTTLGRGSFPALSRLELWLGGIAYGCRAAPSAPGSTDAPPPHARQRPRRGVDRRAGRERPAPGSLDARSLARGARRPKRRPDPRALSALRPPRPPDAHRQCDHPAGRRG